MQFTFFKEPFQNKNRHNIEIVASGNFLPSIKDVLNIGITFLLVVFGWIFFRSNNISHAINYISILFSKSLFSIPEIFPRYVFFYIGLFMLIEWWGREEINPINKLSKAMPRTVNWAFYFSLIILVLYFSDKEQQFIYFQF